MRSTTRISQQTTLVPQQAHRVPRRVPHPPLCCSVHDNLSSIFSASITDRLRDISSSHRALIHTVHLGTVCFDEWTKHPSRDARTIQITFQGPRVVFDGGCCYLASLRFSCGHFVCPRTCHSLSGSSLSICFIQGQSCILYAGPGCVLHWEHVPSLNV